MISFNQFSYELDKLLLTPTNKPEDQAALIEQYMLVCGYTWDQVLESMYEKTKSISTEFN